MKPTTSTATGLLSALSVLLGLFGLAGASQATFGVAIVGLALLCGVLARIAQAGHQHRELLACAPAVSPETTKPLPAAAATLTTEP